MRRQKLAAGQSPYEKMSSAAIGVPTRLTLETWLGWRGLDIAGDAEGIVAALEDGEVEPVRGDAGVLEPAESLLPGALCHR